MKKGDLVLLRDTFKTKKPDDNIGIVLEIKYVNTVIVHWCNGTIHWNELEELVPLT